MFRAQAQDRVSIFRIIEGDAFHGTGECIHEASIHGAIVSFPRNSFCGVFNLCKFSKELRHFEGHTGELTKAIFSSDGKYIVTTSYDDTARVWETQTGKTIVIYTKQGQVI